MWSPFWRTGDLLFQLLRSAAITDDIVCADTMRGARMPLLGLKRA